MLVAFQGSEKSETWTKYGNEGLNKIFGILRLLTYKWIVLFGWSQVGTAGLYHKYDLCIMLVGFFLTVNFSLQRSLKLEILCNDCYLKVQGCRSCPYVSSLLKYSVRRTTVCHFCKAEITYPIYRDSQLVFWQLYNIPNLTTFDFFVCDKIPPRYYISPYKCTKRICIGNNY